MASMSRNNIWIHISIALVLILIAAFAGGIRKRLVVRRLVPSVPADQNRNISSRAQDNEGGKHAEVLVRFRSGTTQNVIKRITSQFNDLVVDRIEAVDGLEVIEDEDGKSDDDVVVQYRALAEVEYAEANSNITLDHEQSDGK